MGSIHVAQPIHTFMSTENNGFQVAVDLNHESKRLETFSSWLASAPIEAARLAKAGFYYTGKEFEVKCFACNIVIKDWKYGDIVVDRHKQLSPSCPFFTRSNNVPIEATQSNKYGISITDSPPARPTTSNTASTDNLRSLRPQVPSTLPASTIPSNNPTRIRPSALKTLPNSVPLAQLRSEEERLKTFTSWPVSFISTRELAKDGFYSLGDGDKVQCVFCRGCIGDWEVNDVISDEHLKHFPQCPFKRGLPVGNVTPGISPLQVPIPEHYFQGVDDAGSRRTQQSNICFNTSPERSGN